MNTMISVSPRIGVVLSEVAQTPNLETAMWRILTEYVDLKTRELREQARTFEVRWGMTFAEFAERLKTDRLGQIGSPTRLRVPTGNGKRPRPC